MMGHRLGLKGWLLAWAAGLFYLLMVLTSPTEVIPATFDVLGGIVGAANSAGDHVGEVHDEYERERLAQEVRAEVCAELLANGVDDNPEACTGTTPTTGTGDEVVDDGDASRYHGPTNALPDPAGVWNRLNNTNQQVAQGLDDAGLTAAGTNQ